MRRPDIAGYPRRLVLKRGMTERLRILLVEDVADDAELVLLELRRSGLHADHRAVASEKSFVDALHEFKPDVILSDFSMPEFRGMAALALAREICPDTPFIFVSGTIGEESAIDAVKSGATDYVMKTNLVRLPAAVERALREGKERAARRKAEGELEALRERLRSVVSALPDVVWSAAVPRRSSAGRKRRFTRAARSGVSLSIPKTGRG